MPDNLQTQSSTPSTLPDTTTVATIEASFSGDTVHAEVATLAKSSGAEGSRTLTLINPATEDKQDTGNTSVASIDTKTPALGQALAAASVPVVLTASQLSTLTPPGAISGYATETTLGTRLSESDFDTKTGSLTETAPGTDTASSGLNGRLQRIAQRLTSLITALGSPFQAGGSIGNTSFASTVADGANVTLGAKADAKSTATDTTAVSAISVLKQVSASAQSVDGKVPALGQALAASSVPVVLTAAQLTTLTPPAAITGFATETTLGTRLSESDFDTKTGSLTETAPATDTASSGLNGRLQRIAQRITSLIALLPTALGSGGGLKVDGSGTALPVSAASLPLPTGAATETTLGTRLSESDFDTKTGSLTETAPATDTASSGVNGRLQRIAQRISSLITALGSPFQAGGSIGNTSFASTVADGANVTLGAKADAKSTATDTTAITIMQVLKQVSASVQLMVFGAGTAAAAQRTTLASDDPAVATLGATTGAKVVTDANGTLQQYLRGLVTFFANSLGSGTSTNAQRIVIATDDTMVGALTETAPATDTASSGLNGRLQRIAQRLSSLISPGLSSSVSVTRPSDTTTYGANDVVGVTGGGTATITFALGAISGSRILITSAALERDATALIANETSYILHLYNVTQPGAQADNAAFDLAAGDRTAYLGNIPIGTPVDLGSTLYVAADGINKQVKLSGTSIFGVLVTVGGYQPVSAAVHVVTLHAIQL